MTGCFRVLAMLLGLGLATSQAVMAQAASAMLKPAERRGEALAAGNCAQCHAIGVKGDSPNPKSPPFRTIGQRYAISDLEEALAEGIVVGHAGAQMPHFVFEPADIADLIAYLKRINRR
jgi:cytochrome c